VKSALEPNRKKRKQASQAARRKRVREKDSDCFRESVSVVLLHVVGGGERKAASTTKNR